MCLAADADSYSITLFTDGKRTCSCNLPLRVTPYNAQLSHQERKKQAGIISAGTPCGAQHHVQVCFAEQFWHVPAGLLPEEGKEEALPMVSPMCQRPVGT